MINNLPDNWAAAKLGDVCKTTSGGTPSRKREDYFQGDIPWVKSGELPDGPIVKIEEYITEEAVKNSSAKLFPPGSLLVAMYGATVGKLGILNRDATTNQAVCAIFPTEVLDTKYLFWYLRNMRSDLIAQAIGGAQPNISQGILRELVIPIAPLEQQKRIVAEIEKQFSRLDEAVANLKRVKANLKRYKAAVLKAAVEGRLVETEAELARRQGRDFETGEQLLQRILKIRRSQWQGNGKYKEPAAPDMTGLPELPAGWVWTTVGVLLQDIEAGKSFKCEERPPTKNEVGVVKVSAVSWGEFDENESKTCREERMINERLLIRPGDFLFSRANTIELVGACVIAKKVTLSVMLSDKILRFRLLVGLNPWVLYNLRSKFGRKEIESLATGNQESMRNIGQGRIRAIRVPLPSIDECGRIVTEVDRRLSQARKVEVQVEINLKRAERLRQSILQQAFTGRLVPQEPIGEPACRLLDGGQKGGKKKITNKESISP